MTNFVINVGTRQGATSPFHWVYWSDDQVIAGSARTKSVLENDVFVAIAQHLNVADDTTFDFTLVYDQPIPWPSALQTALRQLKEGKHDERH